MTPRRCACCWAWEGGAQFIRLCLRTLLATRPDIHHAGAQAAKAKPPTPDKPPKPDKATKAMSKAQLAEALAAAEARAVQAETGLAQLQAAMGTGQVRVFAYTQAHAMFCVCSVCHA